MNRKKFKQQESVHCKVCQRSVLSNEHTWNQHIFGRRHRQLLPEEVTIGVPNGITDLQPFRSYLENLGSLKLFLHNPIENSLIFSFHDINAFTPFIQSDNHIVNDINIAHCASWNVKSFEDVGETKGFRPERVKPPMPIRQNKPFKQQIKQQNKQNAKKGAVLNSPQLQQKTIEIGDSYRDSIREKLPHGLPFEETVEALLKLLKPDPTRSQEITKLICNDLKTFLPFDAKILIYGSRFSNLEFENSDLNIHITNLRKRPDDTQKVLDTLKHNVELTNKFEDPKIFEYRKQQFLQATHKATGIKVEIFVKNIVPVYNSELIKFYLGQEQKLISLTMLIKFWFQCYNLIKKPSFMVYDLYQMIIFFLQRPPYSLPSISELQQTAMPKSHDGWEFGINCKREIVNEQLKSATVAQLFTGFMRFYTKFDYFTYCICPFTGYPVEKIDFYDNLPWEFQNLANRTPANPNFCFIPKFGLTVQDPFEHTKSIAYIPYFAMPKVISLCRGAWYAMNSKKQDLLKILSNCMTCQKATETFELIRTKQKESIASHKLWLQKAKKMFLDVMSKVLYCNIEETIMPHEKKNQQIEKIHYKCISKENVWHNRITNLKEIWNVINGRNLTKLEREIAISAETATTNTPLETEFEFTLILKLRPCKAVVLYRFKSKPLVFEHVKNYLRHMLPQWTEEIEEQQQPVQNIQPQRMALRRQPAAPVVPENAPHQVKPAQLKQETVTSTRKDPETVTSTRKEPETITSTSKEPETVTRRDLEPKAEPETASEEQQDLDEENKDDVEATEVLDEILLDENFLEGLDVIDAWDGDDKPRNPSPEKERSKSHRSHSRTNEASHRSRSKTNETSSSKRPRSERRRSRSPPSQKPRRSRSPRRRFSLTRPYESRDKKRRSRSSEKSATRRDPEKTKRDIHRDKIKCAKDVEKKIISNKLEIVKTGLVPPGMEMETEYTDDASSKKIPTIISRKIDGKSNKRTHPSEQGARPLRGVKRLHRESQQNRTDLKKYHESFLKEVREKLNEARQPEMMMQQQQQQPQVVHQQEYDEQFFIGNSYVAPQQQQHVMYPPVNNSYMPHPQMQHQEMQMYNTSYPMMQQQVIPQQNSFAPVNYNTVPQFSAVVAAPSANVEVSQTSEALAAPAAPPPPALSRNEFEAANWNPERPPDREEQAQKPKSKEEIGKLFEDKKISLSDFLTITAKPEVQSATTEQLQKKIKAISKCQDVIRVMTDGALFGGGIIVRNTNTEATVAKKPHQSPLHRLPKIRFQLNTSDVNISPYSAALNYILKTGGVIKEAINLDGGEDRSRSTDGGDDSTALSRKASQLSQQNQPTPPPPIQQIVIIEECKECKKRKLIEYSTIGTQVIEEELIPPKRRQQESLVYMTPAQLLENENRSKGALPQSPLMNNKFMQQQQQQQQRNVPFFQPPNTFDGRMKNVEQHQQQQKNDRFRNNEIFNRKNHNPNWY